MGKILIVTGGNISKELVSKVVNEESFMSIIAADKGLEIIDDLEIMPQHIVGDFDSLNQNILKKYESFVQVHKYNTEKDFTDTDIAVKLAIKLGATRDNYTRSNRNQARPHTGKYTKHDSATRTGDRV